VSNNPLPRPTATQILKAVFWNRWGAIVGAILAIFGVLDFIDAHFAPRFPAALKAAWGTYYVLPSFEWRTWITIISLALLVVAIHGAYVFALGYSKRWEESTKYKVKFRIDEVSTRVFVQQSSEEIAVITAKIKHQFENEDTHPWTMKQLHLTLHKRDGEDNLIPPKKSKEIYTHVLSDQYMHGSNLSEIPRDQFEGMLIQDGRVTPWYIAVIMLMHTGEIADLRRDYFLRLSMDASNQQPFEANMFVDWAEASRDNGASVISFGAPAIRQFENRRIGH
jgi:hypothetical protein